MKLIEILTAFLILCVVLEAFFQETANAYKTTNNSKAFYIKNIRNKETGFEINKSCSESFRTVSQSIYTCNEASRLILINN